MMGVDVGCLLLFRILFLMVKGCPDVLDCLLFSGKLLISIVV